MTTTWRRNESVSFLKETTRFVIRTLPAGTLQKMFEYKPPKWFNKILVHYIRTGKVPTIPPGVTQDDLVRNFGEILFYRVEKIDATHAGKIVGMILQAFGNETLIETVLHSHKLDHFYNMAVATLKDANMYRLH